MAILNQLHKFSNKLNNASGHYHLYGMSARSMIHSFAWISMSPNPMTCGCCFNIVIHILKNTDSTFEFPPVPPIPPSWWNWWKLC